MEKVLKEYSCNLNKRKLIHTYSCFYLLS